MPSRDSRKRKINVAGPTALGDAVAETRRYASDQQLQPWAEARLCIIVEELIANLIEHGGAQQAIDLELDRTSTAVTVVLEDGGPAFDPRGVPETATVPARGGGAGLRLVRDWSEVVSYETAEGRNRLELSVPLTKA